MRGARGRPLTPGLAIRVRIARPPEIRVAK